MVVADDLPRSFTPYPRLSAPRWTGFFFAEGLRNIRSPVSSDQRHHRRGKPYMNSLIPRWSSQSEMRPAWID